MTIARRVFTVSPLMIGTAVVLFWSPAIALEGAPPPDDPARPAKTSSWTRRSELPVVDITHPEAVTHASVPLASGALTPQIIEADVAKTGPLLGYAALILDSDGADNIFVKLQDNDGDGDFDHLYFYHGNQVGAWPGMTGGAFDVILAPAEQFSSGHVKLTHDGAGNVTVDLTNLDGGVPTLSHTRGGWTPLDGVGVGMDFAGGNATLDDFDVFYSADGSVCDTFDRADGPLGDDWVTQHGNPYIMGNVASGTGSFPNTAQVIYAGDCQGGIQAVEADVSVIGTSLTYSALMMNFDGQDNLFIKLQSNGSSGQFDTVGFYSGFDSGGWPGQTGGGSFFSIGHTDKFSSAHMKVVLYPSGVVRLLITDRDTGGGLLEYQRGGWTVRSGNDAGIGGYGATSYLDDFAVNGVAVCDDFNRSDGSLGPNWITDAGPMAISGNRAHADSSSHSRSIFVGACAGACPSDITGDGVVNVPDLLRLLTDWGDICP